MSSSDQGRTGAPDIATETSSLKKEIDSILSTTGEERINQLLDSPRLKGVVAAMPPEELFFTISQMDAEDVPAVLSHAVAEQIEFLSDIQLWEKARLKRTKVSKWIKFLLSCGNESAGRWLGQIDEAALTLLFSRIAKVKVSEDGEDPFHPATGQNSFSIDGVNYISVPEKEFSAVRTMLILLKNVNEKRYFRLLEDAAHHLDSEFEEHCWQERQKRMSARGFPEWEEAMEVYARLTVDNEADLPERPRELALYSDNGLKASPRYLVSFPCENAELLKLPMSQGETVSAETFSAELAYLTNKVAVADGLALDHLESYHIALRKVAAYVSIGLEILSGGDKSKAVGILERQWLQHLFRIGWTRIRRVRSKANRLFDFGWPGGHRERLLLLDSPLAEILDGLIRKHPQWYIGDNNGPSYRLFQRLSEVDRADWCVEKADFLGRYLLTVVDMRLNTIEEALVELDTENLKASTIFLTAIANAALGRKFRFAPLERSVVPDALARLWEKDAPPRRVRPGMEEASILWSQSLGGIPVRQTEYLREFIHESFNLLEEEFGSLASGEVPDPRFTKGLWIE